jgi:hypothetical protein
VSLLKGNHGDARLLANAAVGLAGFEAETRQVTLCRAIISGVSTFGVSGGDTTDGCGGAGTP